MTNRSTGIPLIKIERIESFELKTVYKQLKKLNQFYAYVALIAIGKELINYSTVTFFKFCIGNSFL